MKMTKTLALATLVAGSLFAGSLALPAQDAPKTPPAGAGPAAHARLNADQIAKDLGLTDDQKAKLKAALEDMETKVKALRQDAGLSPEDRRAKLKEIREDLVNKLKEFLTPDQLEKFKQMHRSHQPAGGAGGQKPQTPPAKQ